MLHALSRPPNNQPPAIKIHFENVVMHGLYVEVELLSPVLVSCLQHYQDEFDTKSKNERYQVFYMASPPPPVDIAKEIVKLNKPPNAKQLAQLEEKKKRIHNKRVGSHQRELVFIDESKAKVVEKFPLTVAKKSKISESKVVVQPKKLKTLPPSQLTLTSIVAAVKIKRMAVADEDE
jgi:hypothetical protein